MLRNDKKTADIALNRPVTRQKNATTHPGTDALSTRRDREVIEKEKLERKARGHRYRKKGTGVDFLVFTKFQCQWTN
jgi:hypothetical protein